LKMITEVYFKLLLLSTRWQNTVQRHNECRHPKSLPLSFRFTFQVHKIAVIYVTAKTCIWVWLNVTTRTPVSLPWTNYPINVRRLVFVSCTLCSTWFPSLIRNLVKSGFILSTSFSKSSIYVLLL
jgi:hypothetical protein